MKLTRSLPCAQVQWQFYILDDEIREKDPSYEQTVAAPRADASPFAVPVLSMHQ